MKLAAATAVAECVSPVDLAPEYVGPRIFHLGGLRKVAEAVGKRGDSTGVARRIVLPGGILYGAECLNAFSRAASISDKGQIPTRDHRPDTPST